MSKVRREASKEDIVAIQDWLKSQPHLPDFMDELLIRKFLHTCKYSLQVTKSTMDLYYTMRYNAPEIFSNRDPLAPEIQQVFTVTDVLVLPKLTKDNYRVLIYRLVDPDPERYFFNNATKAFFMLLDTRIATEVPLSEGEVPIFDMTGASFRHLTKMVLSTVRKYMAYVQEAQPVTLKQVHFYNASTLADKLFSVVKPMIADEVIQHIHFHTPGSQTLYEYVPKDLLPNEYGGSAGPAEEMIKKSIKEMEALRDYFLDEDKWKVNESKRIQKSLKAESLINEGSFRSLSID